MKKLLSLGLALLMIAGSMVVGVSASEEPAAEAPVAVGYQVTPFYSLTEADPSPVYDIRFIASVGEWITTCSKVGFEITATLADSSTKTWTASTYTVYSELTGTTPDGAKLSSMKAADKGATALLAMTITGIPFDQAVTFTAKPFVVYQGDTVYGDPATCTPENAAATGLTALSIASAKVPSSSDKTNWGAMLHDNYYGNATNGNKFASGAASLYQPNSAYHTNASLATYYGYHVALELESASAVGQVQIFARNLGCAKELDPDSIKIFGTNDDAVWGKLQNAQKGHNCWNGFTGDWTELTVSGVTMPQSSNLVKVAIGGETQYKYICISFEIPQSGETPSGNDRPDLYEIRVLG